MANLVFDVGVIGAGPAGLAAAADLRAAGKSVVVIENYLWGGTCPNYGCDPKKILLAAVEAKEKAQALNGLGVQGELRLDWSQMMARKNQFTNAMPARTQASLTSSDITQISGQAQFIDAKTVTILQQNTTVQATDWIISVGQRAAELAIPGGEYAIDYEKFMNLATLPDEIVIIGGGYIAFEFAAIAAGVGAHVTMLVRGERVLSNFDEELARELAAQLTLRGVTILYQTEVKAITKSNAQFELELSTDTTLTTNLVVRAIGRIGNHDRLNLAATGVETQTGGVVVDQHLQTAAPHLYAVGDVAQSPVPKLTTTGYYEGRAVAQQILGHHEPVTYPAIPEIVYATPKLAQVGVTTAQAATDQTLRMVDLNMTDWFTYYRVGEKAAHAKVILAENDQIVGATVLSHEADELINSLTDAVNAGADYQAMRNKLYAYPTVASDLEYFFG